MKKYILFAVMTALLPSMAEAQLKVDQNGSVGINNPTINGGNLNVKQSEDKSQGIHLNSCKRGLFIGNYNTSMLTVESYGVLVNSNINTANKSYGSLNRITNNNDSSYGFAIGVAGIANGNSGRKHGVFGSIVNEGNGAGVFGTTGLTSPIAINGRYAGYFRGNVKVTGTIDGTLISSSDGQLKENVEPLAEGTTRGESTLTKLGLLTPVSYNYKDTTTAKPKTDTRTKIDRKDLTEADEEFWNELFEEEIVEEPNQVMEKRHFGFIAQELQEVYPDLVYQKDDGYLAVNYTELIPILVQSIKELNEKVEMLSGNKTRQNMAAQSSNFDETASMDALDLTDVATMNQNVPNPFTEKTDIAIYLPETVQTATLYIYDLSGKQLEQHPIKGRGNTVMTIHADRMDAGMYVYSLIADKKVVTTKKMIVVK